MVIGLGSGCGYRLRNRSARIEALPLHSTKMTKASGKASMHKKHAGESLSPAKIAKYVTVWLHGRNVFGLAACTAQPQRSERDSYPRLQRLLGPSFAEMTTSGPQLAPTTRE